MDDGMPKDNDAIALQQLGEDIDGGMPKENDVILLQHPRRRNELHIVQRSQTHRLRFLRDRLRCTIVVSLLS